MSIHKAVFLDRDGTINVEKNYVYKIEDFVFLPGVFDALRMLQEAGFKLIVITNQSGIARGYYSIEAYEKLNSWMLEELKKQGIIITAVYFCPHHPYAIVPKYRLSCSCRKPGLGLFEQAVKDYDLDLAQSFAIGDKLRDCSICESTDCHGFLISQNEELSIIKRVKEGGFKNIEYALDLPMAVERILKSA